MQRCGKYHWELYGTIVCVTGMVKTEGEPSGHIFNPENYPQPCVEHITLCENRTSPYVIRNYTG